MRPTLVVNCVGLTPSMIGANMPHVSSVVEEGWSAPIRPVLPAVTCSVQSTYLTGTLPRDHGIVANGWYFRDLAEVWLWRQSNRLVQGEKLWHEARRRDASFTVCNMFWWYNMHADVDYSLTPRPLYLADGRKLPGVYGRPLAFRRMIEERLPTFPLFNFWGPTADITSTRWIADATLLAIESVDPTLCLVYLPHLDYDLQRYGPSDSRIPAQVRALDHEVGRLVEAARRTGRRVILLSEYGISEMSEPVHINRALRKAGFLETVPQLDRENLDPGASRAFAMADHQVAHVYVHHPEDIAEVRATLERLDGVDVVVDRTEQAAFGLDHPRSGELVAIASSDRWFTYYFWESDDKAPDYARCVDIHRKPGYDPAELFLDPRIGAVRLRIALKLLAKKLGMRTVMDFIPLDASLVRGSHGRIPDDPTEGPVLIASHGERPAEVVDASAVRDVILNAVFEGD